MIQYRGHMAVGTGASDLEGGGQNHVLGIAAFEHLAESLDLSGRPVREVGDGTVVDLTLFAEGFAKKDRGRRVPVGDNGHVHVDNI